MHFKKNLLKFYRKIASYNNILDIILQRHFRWKKIILYNNILDIILQRHFRWKKKKLSPTIIFLILFYNDIFDERKETMHD